MQHALSPDRQEGVSGKSARAAQYVRMSTEHQKYSTENQAEILQQYAAKRGIVIEHDPAILHSRALMGFSVDDVSAPIVSIALDSPVPAYALITHVA